MIVAPALSAVLLVAGMEVLLVQWTSLVVPPTTLAIDFAATAVVLAAAVGGIFVIATAVRRSAPRSTFPTWVLVSLAFYDLSRIRTEKLSWSDPTLLALAAVLGVGCWCELRRTDERSEHGDAVAAIAWVTANSVAWDVFHIRGFTPALEVLMLVVAAAAAQVSWIWWRSNATPRATTGKPTLRLSPVVLMTALGVWSYPLAPGFLRPELRSGAEAPPATSRTRPNVIVVVMDTVRADHLSLYGYERATSPYLARFADRAHFFRRAIANSNWSLPSHATLLTGLLPHQHRAHTVISSITTENGAGGAEMARLAHQPLAEQQVTLAERLREIGYLTALVSANYAWLSTESGLLQGFDYVDNRPGMLVGWEPFCAAYLRHQPVEALAAFYARETSSKLSARQIVDHARDFLERQSRRPFFLLINFMDAHAPYTSALHADAVAEIHGRLATGPQVAANVDSYDRSLAFLDHQLGRLFADLETRGLFDDTLIVVTSDHGERFGEGARGWHGDDLSQASIFVPLLIKMPRQVQGERVERRAQLADIAPTILDAAGLPAPREFFGSVLGRQSRAVVAESYLAAGGVTAPGRPVPMVELDAKLPTMWALFDGDWKLVRDSRGRELLYDLANDPAEVKDVAPDRPEVARQMAERLASLLPPQVFSEYRTPSAQADVSRATVEKLKSLGYAQ